MRLTTTTLSISFTEPQNYYHLGFLLSMSLVYGVVLITNAKKVKMRMHSTNGKCQKWSKWRRSNIYEKERI